MSKRKPKAPPSSLADFDPFADDGPRDPLATPEDVEIRSLLCQVGMPNPVCDSAAFYSVRLAELHRALCAGCEDAEGIDAWRSYEGLPVPNDTAEHWASMVRWYKADVRALAELAEYHRRRELRAKLMRAVMDLESWK